MPGTASSPSTSPPPVRVFLAASNLLPFPCASLAHLFFGDFFFLFSSWAPFSAAGGGGAGGGGAVGLEERSDAAEDSLVSVLAVYDGFCNLKQVSDLRFLLCFCFFASVTSFSPPIQWWRCNFFSSQTAPNSAHN